MNTKESFLAAVRSKPEEVTVAGADGQQLSVRLKKLTSAEVQATFVGTGKGLTDQQRGLLIQRKAVQVSVVDEHGESFLTEQDVAAGMDMSVVKELFDHVLRINGMESKAADDAQGN
jgi:hypothetical protein